MIETDWLSKQLRVQGTFRECQALTSFFEWSGPPIIGVEGLTIENGRVINTSMGTPRFGAPEKMVRLMDQYDENQHRYTVHDNVQLDLYRLRTEDSTKGAYFIPSEKPLDGLAWLEGTLTVEQTGADEYRLWHQRTKFSMESEALDTHVRVCTPLDTGIPQVSETRGQETGLGERFEPLVPVQPMANTLRGAAVE